MMQLYYQVNSDGELDLVLEVERDRFNKNFFKTGEGRLRARLGNTLMKLSTKDGEDREIRRDKHYHLYRGGPRILGQIKEIAGRAGVKINEDRARVEELKGIFYEGKSVRNKSQRAPSAGDNSFVDPWTIEIPEEGGN